MSGFTSLTIALVTDGLVDRLTEEEKEERVGVNLLTNKQTDRQMKQEVRRDRMNFIIDKTD